MSANEIMEQMEKFTVDEQERINLMAAGKAENITMEDVKLFSRWETSLALADARFKAENEAIKARTDAEIEQREKIAKAAFENLEAQAELAKARLEMVKNGQI